MLVSIPVAQVVDESYAMLKQGFMSTLHHYSSASAYSSCVVLCEVIYQLPEECSHEMKIRFGSWKSIFLHLANLIRSLSRQSEVARKSHYGYVREEHAVCHVQGWRKSMALDSAVIS